jgi:hypothetical protein
LCVGSPRPGKRAHELPKLASAEPLPSFVRGPIRSARAFERSRALYRLKEPTGRAAPSGQHGRARAMPISENLQQVASLLRGKVVIPNGEAIAPSS